jgi:hypothetical protein
MRNLIIALAVLLPAMAMAKPNVVESGYLQYNGRCPDFGVAFHLTLNEEPPSGTCVYFPALEALEIPEDAKREAIRAMTERKVEIHGTAKGKRGYVWVQSVDFIR